MSDKGILDWFGKRKESSVTIGARGHVMVVRDTVAELKNALDCMVKGDAVAAVKCTERLMLCEKEADRIEDKLCAEISRGELSVQERETLIRFVRQTDKVANWAKEGAIYLQLLNETNARVPVEIWSELAHMTDELIEEIKFLVGAIENMNADPKKVFGEIDSLNDQERIIDGLYFTCIKHAHLSEMDPRGLYLVDELIEAIEMAADSGKSCGDAINIMLISRGV